MFLKAFENERDLNLIGARIKEQRCFPSDFPYGRPAIRLGSPEDEVLFLVGTFFRTPHFQGTLVAFLLFLEKAFACGVWPYSEHSRIVKLSIGVYDKRHSTSYGASRGGRQSSSRIN
jgi:hypothetical protein